MMAEKTGGWFFKPNQSTFLPKTPKKYRRQPDKSIHELKKSS
jgi:hypothetical protein